MTTAPDGVIAIGGAAIISMVRLLLVTACGDAHTALEVTMHLTTAPFDKDELVKTAVSVPSFVPLTDH